MTENDFSAMHEGRTQTNTEALSSAEPAFLPGLTILYHVRPDRIGERTLLVGLDQGRDFLLSRLQGDFAQPGGKVARPLNDPRLSRSSICFRAGPAGSIHLDVSRTRARVVAEGRPVAGSMVFASTEIDRGVVLLLAGHLVLLLHRFDPLGHRRAPVAGLLGESSAMQRVREDIQQVADLEVPVLVRGESGTGKELVARAIHESSPRREGPYVVVNMAAIPASLAAAELFGAARGAFTGASHRRGGFFGQARGGTLFLDEIGEISSEVQPLLLRALETGEVQPVGAGVAEKVDVRMISATDSDLESRISNETFRAALFHRLSGGYTIHLPPLRDRREDFGRLFLHFLRLELEAVARLQYLDERAQPWLSGAVISRLAAWHWPGNVRQLRNIVRQLVIANRDADPPNRFKALDDLLGNESPSQKVPSQKVPGAVPPPVPSRVPVALHKPSDISEEQLLAALRSNRFRPVAAADALAIPRSSIYDLMQRYPGVRKAAELTADEIAAVRDLAGGSVEKAAEALEVSAQALRRRMSRLKIEL